jgi:multiple sugar transport system substrate-binding protein
MTRSIWTGWRPSRRKLLIGAGALGMLGASRFVAAQSAPPITLVINQSPWLASFQKMVAAYVQETGNQVELDVNPFGGSLEKQRNSVRAKEGQFDLLIMNSGWIPEMYAGGFVTPVSDIDSGFTLDPGIYTLGDTVFYDAQKKAMAPGGKLMAVPIHPNIPMLYFRGDLYQDKGLAQAETFAKLEENAKALNDPPRRYGIVQRGARGAHVVAYDFYPYLFGHGGSLFRDQSAGDYTVTLNSPEGKAALDYYVRLAREAGHPQTAALDQAEVIQNMLTGKAGHILAVIAAWSQMDDAAKSIVVDKVEVTLPPHVEGKSSAPPLGHFLGGIAHNTPDDRKRAAFAFLRWFQSKEAQMKNAEMGGVPVHRAAYESPLAEERKNRWMKPVAKALPLAVNIYQFPEASEVIAVLELGLNRAVAGEIETAAALNDMAGQIHAIMARHGYQTNQLPPL